MVPETPACRPLAARALSNVVLPEPEGPMIASISPGFTIPVTPYKMVFSTFFRPTDVAATWWFCCISCSLLLLLDFLLLGQRLQHIIAVAAWSAIVTLLLTSTNCFPHTPTPTKPNEKKTIWCSSYKLLLLFVCMPVIRECSLCIDEIKMVYCNKCFSPKPHCLEYYLEDDGHRWFATMGRHH